MTKFNGGAVIRGQHLDKMNPCYELLKRTKSDDHKDLIILRKWEKYLKAKNKPFVITIEDEYYHFFVAGTKKI